MHYKINSERVSKTEFMKRLDVVIKLNNSDPKLECKLCKKCDNKCVNRINYIEDLQFVKHYINNAIRNHEPTVVYVSMLLETEIFKITK